MPFAKTGEDFEAFVRQQIEEISRLSRQVGLM
jgi:tripartite-type tricarboxylate transporter receptor subunit TctC